MTRSSRYAIRVPAFALVSAFWALGALAQGSWLDAVRDLDARGRTREALAQLDGDAARLAGDSGARLLRGVLLAKLGRTAEARELYQGLIRDHPEQPEAYNNLAVMYAAAGDYDTAIEILKQGLATHPSYRTTYDNLTKVYGKLAGEAYSKALGDERIDAEPLRLALINGAAGTANSAAAPPAASARGPLVPVSDPAPPAPARRPATVTPATGDGEAEAEARIWQTVQAWADAWSAQRPERYLSFYGPEFVPPGGGSRAEWEELRRRRLRAPAYIRISLALLELEQPGPGRAIARFVQSYESDRFSDTVTKALELAQSAAGWRIVAESVVEESAQ